MFSTEVLVFYVTLEGGVKKKMRPQCSVPCSTCFYIKHVTMRKYPPFHLLNGQYHKNFYFWFIAAANRSWAFCSTPNLFFEFVFVFVEILKFKLWLSSYKCHERHISFQCCVGEFSNRGLRGITVLLFGSNSISQTSTFLFDCFINNQGSLREDLNIIVYYRIWQFATFKGSVQRDRFGWRWYQSIGLSLWERRRVFQLILPFCSHVRDSLSSRTNSNEPWDCPQGTYHVGQKLARTRTGTETQTRIRTQTPRKWTWTWS